jgi:hypothetical protein
MCEFFERGLGRVPASQYSVMRIPLLPDGSARPIFNGSEALPNHSVVETRATLPGKEKGYEIPEESEYGAGIGQAE